MYSLFYSKKRKNKMNSFFFRNKKTKYNSDFSHLEKDIIDSIVAYILDIKYPYWYGVDFVSLLSKNSFSPYRRELIF